jgi:thiol-disulfide isomerase/thioredoxin
MVHTITDQEFEAYLKENPKVIVKYFADWCGSCKMFAPKFKRLSNDERFKDISFIEVNAEENELARHKAGVDNLPFIATFSNGELKAASATSKEELVVNMLEQLN